MASADRNWTDVETTLDQLAAARPNEPEISLLQADVGIAQGRLKEAQALLETARTQMPESIALRCALAELALRDSDFPRSGQLLDEAVLQLGDSVAVRVARARLAVRRDGDKAGPELRTLSANTDSLSKEDRLLLWRDLVLLAAACGDTEHSQQLCRQVADAEPGDLNAWLQMLSVALEQKDDKTADEAMGQIKRIEGEEQGPIWSYCKAAALNAQAAKSDNTDLRVVALRHVNRTLETRPQWPQALLLAAVLADQQGDAQTAITHYMKVIELGNETTQVMREAIRLLTSQSRYAEADSLLTRLEQQASVITPDLQRLRARISGGLENFEAALPAARSVAETSEEYQDHLWLARLCGLFAIRQRDAGADEEAAKLIAEGERWHTMVLPSTAVGVPALAVEFFVSECMT